MAAHYYAVRKGLEWRLSEKVDDAMQAIMTSWNDASTETDVKNARRFERITLRGGPRSYQRVHRGSESDTDKALRFKRPESGPERYDLWPTWEIVRLGRRKEDAERVVEALKNQAREEEWLRSRAARDTDQAILRKCRELIDAEKKTIGEFVEKVTKRDGAFTGAVEWGGVEACIKVEWWANLARKIIEMSEAENPSEEVNTPTEYLRYLVRHKTAHAKSDLRGVYSGGSIGRHLSAVVVTECVLDFISDASEFRYILFEAESKAEAEATLAARREEYPPRSVEAPATEQGVS